MGSYETIRVLSEAAVPREQMICVAGGENLALANDVFVGVFPSQHSCVLSHTRPIHSDDVCLGDLDAAWQEQQKRMADLAAWMRNLDDSSHAHLRATNQGECRDGGALVYMIRTPDGSVRYRDTAGHWAGIFDGLQPDLAILAAAGRGNIDGEPTQGTLASFPAKQAALLGPRRVVLARHDDWHPGFSGPIDIEPIRAELAKECPGAELIELGYMNASQILPI